jgi:hypothetical protein
MSIQLIAKDLYRYQKEVERLERELAMAPVAKQADVADRLRQTKSERDLLRRALDGVIGR